MQCNILFFSHCIYLFKEFLYSVLVCQRLEIKCGFVLHITISKFSICISVNFKRRCQREGWQSCGNDHTFITPLTSIIHSNSPPPLQQKCTHLILVTLFIPFPVLSLIVLNHNAPDSTHGCGCV